MTPEQVWEHIEKAAEQCFNEYNKQRPFLLRTKRKYKDITETQKIRWRKYAIADMYISLTLDEHFLYYRNSESAVSDYTPKTNEATCD